MPKPRASSAITPVRRRLKVDFSMTGFVYAILMAFMGLAAMSSQANLLFGVFGLMIGILLVSAFVNKVVLRKLTMQRGLPESAVVGVPAIITYEIRNGKRFWPSLSVTVAELDGAQAFTRQPQAYMLHAAARMTAIVPAQIVPKRRGLYELDRYQFSTSFPFGFVKRATHPDQRHEREAIVVYPALADVDVKLLQLMRSAERSGTTIRPRRGGTDEFYGLKEFRTGENPRYIYWRRSARVGTLVAKEMTQVAPPRILLLVDTCCLTDTLASRTTMERNIAMAASLASHALEQGLSVGLVAWSGEWIKVAPGRGKRHRRDLLTLLARLGQNTQHGAADLVSQAIELQEDTNTLVLFSAGEGASPGRSVGGFMMISPDSMQAAKWFRFNPSVDFANCSPAGEDDKETR